MGNLPWGDGRPGPFTAIMHRTYGKLFIGKGCVALWIVKDFRNGFSRT